MNQTYGTFKTGVVQPGCPTESQILLLLSPSTSSAERNSGDCKARFTFPVVYERDQLNTPNPL